MYSQAKVGGQNALHQGLLLYSITWLLMYIIPKPLRFQCSKRTRRKSGHIYSKPSTQHIWGFGVVAADATKCTLWLSTICLGHHKTGPCKGNLSKEPFAACLICHMGDYIGGGEKKRLFFPPPPKWAFLPPCASLEINFQHLAAFSHDSVRLPWPGASLILLLHQRCLYLIDPPASEREREEP